MDESASASPPEAAPEDFADWFALAHTPGVSRGAARKLLAAFGGARAVFDAGPRAWEQVIPARVAATLAQGVQDPAHLQARERCRQWLRGGARRTVIALDDARYPQRLLQTADPPTWLYADGDTGLLHRRCMAVVGSRKPTAQGRQHARQFAQGLADAGFTVVSGLAHGIDAAAHEAALDRPGGTIAVVGTGLDQVYPPAHADLALRIVGRGLMLSEFPPGSPPLAEHFPQRNRIIAGLSEGVLVVEAALASGSLITARLAAEASREVFAIPGSIQSAQAKGCHALIKQGAKLVEALTDILEELQAAAPAATGGDETPATPAGGDDTADPLLEALGYEPIDLDSLSLRTGWSAAELAVRLLERELNGEVARLPGGLYQRTRSA